MCAVFYDSEPNSAVLTGVTIAENVAATKQLSGVFFYTTGSTFTVDILDLDFLNGSSFPTTQVNIDGSEYGLPTLNLAGTDLTGWVNDHDDIDDTYQKTDWAISAVNFCNVSLTGNIGARTVDWVNGAYVNSADASIAVDTYADNSSGIVHDFRTEDDRYTSTWTQPWDSTQDLNAYD
ncbi:MAG TPA: hypothetical protein VMZ04_10045, partial [Anaerolineae bacterium]|nr:hypothetical protein [Anaerolineae bacterium]